MAATCQAKWMYSMLDADRGEQQKFLYTPCGSVMDVLWLQSLIQALKKMLSVTHVLVMYEGQELGHSALVHER